MDEKIVIVAARRTAVGGFNGSLSTIPASTLGATVVKALLEQTNVKPDQIDDVILGQVLTAAAGQNPARQTVIESGLPHTVPAMTINQVCGSGLRAVALAAQAIKCGDAKIVIAGGQENMSLSPHALPKSRRGTVMGNWELVDTMIVDGLWDAFNKVHMGVTAENIAEDFTISREEQDAFAAASQKKAAEAQKACRFKDQIVTVMIPQRKGDPVAFESDEHLKPGTTAESLAKLRPAFKKEGSVTAGNASGLNDGAAMVMLMTESTAKELGLTPMASVKAYATSGVDPRIMGTGPIPATQRCLERAGWKHTDLDLVEANEAFAAQAISVNRKIGWDTDKVNVNGGAIALGHPIGASGCRILVDLLYEMARRDAKKGLATLCIGGGQGVALAVER